MLHLINQMEYFVGAGILSVGILLYKRFRQRTRDQPILELIEQINPIEHRDICTQTEYVPLTISEEYIPSETALNRF